MEIEKKCLFSVFSVRFRSLEQNDFSTGLCCDNALLCVAFLTTQEALELAQKTKDVLNKDDQATQTPSFELLDQM